MVPGERRIGRRIGMERREEHVAAVPEDILRAVAVMVIHIEDRDARHAAVDGRLRGDRSGVEMAIAAQIIAPRMMAGRRSEEQTSELQSLMRTSYAVFCLKKQQ